MNCGKVLIVPTEMVGRVAVCSACNHRVRVTQNSPSNTPSATSKTPTNSGSARRAISPGQKQPVNRGGDPTSTAARRSTPQSKSGAHATPPESRATGAERPYAGDPRSQTKPSLDDFASLSENPSAAWFVRVPEGGQYGPANNSSMRNWIKEGRIGPATLVWRSDWTDWLPADRVFPGLFSNTPKIGDSTRADVNKVEAYLNRRRQKFRLKPAHWAAIGFGLLALIFIFSKIF
jgi:hypothetical protein